MKKVMVLSSGGADSTTCIALAIEKYTAANVSTVSIAYGQKHRKELVQAEKIARYYGLPHYELDLTAIFANCESPLIASSHRTIVHKSYAEQIAENGEGPVATYVPFRNGLMLSAVASLAQSLYPDDRIEIYLGAHADDAAGSAYPDCSEEFTQAMDRALSLGTYGRVHLVSPLVRLNKAGVIAEGLRLKVPYELTWSCYEGGSKPCGKCATCIDRANAFKANGVRDPALSD